MKSFISFLGALKKLTLGLIKNELEYEYEHFDFCINVIHSKSKLIRYTFERKYYLEVSFNPAQQEKANLDRIKRAIQFRNKFRI